MLEIEKSENGYKSVVFKMGLANLVVGLIQVLSFGQYRSKFAVNLAVKIHKKRSKNYKS